MELTSILLARAMAWVEPSELNKSGLVFYPELVKALVDRYQFQGWPKTLEDFDEAKGVTFVLGKRDKITIDKFIIYRYGLVMETTVSTDASKDLLEEALEWGRSNLSLTYDKSMIKRWQFASQIVFRSNAIFTQMNPALEKLAKAVTDHTKAITGEHLSYELSILSLDYDQLSRKHPLGRFSIQRRDNTPYSENKYFSDAPLPTSIHIELLKAFEKDFLS